MFKLRRLTRAWVFVGLVVCTVFLAGANPEVGEARPLLATSPSLGAAETFAVLGAAAVTNTGVTILNGDLGVSPGASITGSPVVNGTTHINDSVAQLAQTNTATAYSALSQPCDYDQSGTDLGGLTLIPGVYCFSSSAQLTNGLILNAQNNSSAVWIFRIGSTLTTASGSSITIINAPAPNVAPCNVFWQVGSSATLGTNTGFQGNILALESITLNTGANVIGRALAQTGAVTLDTNNFSFVACGGPTAVGLSNFRAATITAGDVSHLTITLLLFGGGIGGLATWLGWQRRKARSKSK